MPSQSPSESSARLVQENSPLSKLFSQAAKAGRASLSKPELDELLAAYRLCFAAPALGAAATAVLRISLIGTREFGMVLRAGFAGSAAALDQSNYAKDRAAVCAIAELTRANDFLLLFKRTLAYQELANAAQLLGQPTPDAQLIVCFESLLELANDLSPSQYAQPASLRQLTLELGHSGAQLALAGASCSLAATSAVRLRRPIHKIDQLLHPTSIGIIGVSATGMNFGRIILRNLMGSGYAKEKIRIIRPGESEIDGVQCVQSLTSLPHRLDLLIVAVAAAAVYALVDEIIACAKVETVMLIPGCLGETQLSREPAAALAQRINAAHAQSDGGPIFLGANCLGVVSHPGAYDSWFIPLERLPKPQKKTQRNSVMLSQSGAFMITRLSQNPWLDPNYMVALGNQTDLTHGDLLSYFSTQAGIATIGIYVEGFKDLDGLDFARAVRSSVLNGKQVVIYKSGRSAPGQRGVMGHTASCAGDPVLFDSVLRQAGAIVTDDLSSFDDLFYLAGALHDKKIGGNRLGGISGAGFEAVGIADSIEADNFSLEMATLEPATVARVQAVLSSKRLDALVEVRNPIDINPGADDEAHLQITEAFLQDPNIDAVVVGLDPTAPAVRSLEQSQLRPGYDITDAKSTVQLMPALAQRNAKPLIGVVDGGHLYDAMCARLMDQGICVFRNCARATKALVRYVQARQYADFLRRRP